MIGFRKVRKSDSELENNLMIDRKLMSNFFKIHFRGKPVNQDYTLTELKLSNIRSNDEL